MLINFKVIWANHDIFRTSVPRVASSFCVRISRLGINGVSWRVFIEFFSDQWVINERLDIDAMTLTGDGGVGTGNESPVILEVSPNSTYCLTTRHARDVLCCGCWAARRDTLVTTSATRTTRVQGRRHGVDWGGHVHLTFSRSCSWDWCKCRVQKTKHVHASTTRTRTARHARQARHARHGKRSSQRVQHARHVVVTWRNERNLGYTVDYVCSASKYRIAVL